MPRDTLELPPGVPPIGLDQVARRVLAGWLFLALGSLAVAGTLVLLLVLARIPHAPDWLPWPGSEFFRKALVAHVVFAVIVWFLAMLGGLSALARPAGRLDGVAGLFLAMTGTGLLLLPMLSDASVPSLNHYVPVLVHPLFYSGLGLLAAGVAVPVLHLLLRPPVWGGALAVGVGAAGVLFLLVLICFALAALRLPAGADWGAWNEDLFWGAGHLLQFVQTALLLTGWQVLGERACGRSPLPPEAWRLTVILLVLAALPGPLFYAVYPLGSTALRQSFTTLYWVGLPLPPLVTAIATLRLLRGGGWDWRSPARIALVLSLAVSALGGLFGLFASGGDIRAPAHYHAEIGGVNLVFMGLIFTLLLPALQRDGGHGGAVGGRLVRAQFWLYGLGQALFSLGLFIAGSAGVALTGLGGAVAVSGGVLFVVLALRRLSGGER